MPQTTTEFIEEIKLLMQYAVDQEHMAQAVNLLEKYDTDRVAINIFHHFYSYLPEATNDAIKVLRQIGRRQSTFLICVTTTIDDYLYLASTDEAAFLGVHREGILDAGVREIFGFEDNAAFIKACGEVDKLPVHTPAILSPDLCPVCATGHGEMHTFGCPIEICPWCEGQLANCDCRFERLETKKISKDSQLKKLLSLLNEKGRVPFNKDDGQSLEEINTADH